MNQTNPTPALEQASTSFDFSRLIKVFGPLFGLLIVLGIFTGVNGLGFLSLGNIQAMLADAAIVAIAALGMTLVIIGGGIDLSTGSIVAFSSVMCAKMLLHVDPTQDGDLTLTYWVVALGAGIGTGLLCGLVNGLSVVVLRVAPFIATLGMLSVARGLAKWQAANKPIDISYSFGDWVSPYPIPGFEWAYFAPSVWLALLLAIVVALVLHRTVFGRHVVALGSSELTARLCGLRINGLKLSLYMLAGACAGLAGVFADSPVDTRGSLGSGRP